MWQENHATSTNQSKHYLEDNGHPPRDLIVHFGESIVDPIRKRFARDQHNGIKSIGGTSISCLDTSLRQICRDGRGIVTDSKAGTASSNYKLSYTIGSSLDDGANNGAYIAHDDGSATSRSKEEEAKDDRCDKSSQTVGIRYHWHYPLSSVFEANSVNERLVKKDATQDPGIVLDNRQSRLRFGSIIILGARGHSPHTS